MKHCTNCKSKRTLYMTDYTHTDKMKRIEYICHSCGSIQIYEEGLKEEGKEKCPECFAYVLPKPDKIWTNKICPNCNHMWK